MRLIVCMAALGVSLPFSLVAQAAQPAPTPSTQAAAAPRPDETIFVLNGKAWTRNAWDTFVDSLPEGTQQTLKGNPAEFVRQLAVIDFLTKKALADGLLDKEPYKTRWELERLKLISTFLQEQTQNTTGASDEQVRAYYENNRDRFTTVTLKMIYLAPGAGGNNMAQLAKAQDLYQQIVKGADFVRLVRAHSEEPGSKERDGELGTVSKGDALPDAVKAVVFAMKKGDVSKPVEVENGIYIFRCEEAKTDKYEDVREKLRTEVRQRIYMEWFDAQRKQSEVKFLRQDYLSK